MWQVAWPPHIAALFHEQQPTLTPAELRRALEDPEAPHHSAALYINELELLGMAVMGWLILQDAALLARLREEQRAIALFGDNMPAVRWLQKAGCTRRVHTAGELVRFMGTLEISHDVCFSTNHVKGEENVIADYMSRGWLGSAEHPAAAAPPNLSGLTLVQVPSQLCDKLFGMLVMGSDCRASPPEPRRPMLQH
jgi:hypothetical protein